MDVLGIVHTALAVAALILGPLVFVRTKGDRRHVLIGRMYAIAMLLVNVTGLFIYDLFGGWGLFHWFAVFGLVTLAAGFVPVYLKRPAGSWIELHYHFICWSYVGLVAAAFSEFFTRLPDFWPSLAGVLPRSWFWVALFACIAASMAVGFYVITFRRVGLAGFVPEAATREA